MRSRGGAITQRRRMLLPKRTAKSLGMMVAAIVAVAALSYFTQRQSERTRARTSHSLAVLLSLEELSTLVKDVETNQRGYLLTDDPSFRARYEEAARELTPRLSELE